MHSDCPTHFLRPLGEALHKRAGAPLREVIYDAVMEALQQIPIEPETPFEARLVQDYMDWLVTDDCCRYMQLTTLQGQAIARAYTEVRRARALEVAGRWLVSAERHSDQPDLALCCLRGLAEAFAIHSQASDLSASNQGICAALQSDHANTVMSRLAAAGGDDSQRRKFGFRLACFATGARWALAAEDFVRQGGLLFSTIDVYDDSRRRYSGRSADIPIGSTSQAILNAFEQQAQTPSDEIARRWIECYCAYRQQGGNMIVASCVTFQQALGLVDRAGLDHCHEDQIPEGLRRVLLSQRAANIVAALPTGARQAGEPNGCHCTEPEELAQQIRDLMLGVIWGLGANRQP